MVHFGSKVVINGFVDGLIRRLEVSSRRGFQVNRLDYWFVRAFGHWPITSLLSRMVNLAVMVPDIVAAILGDILPGHVIPSTWRLTRLVREAAPVDRPVSLSLELRIQS